ncbi:DUF3015 family protein [Zhongshania marina]|uniref:DUF3015 family protein n=1 Tax=Zhongshania marina TaxID=2304603 RepID=UPI001E347A69|nr:DUF3015 family protein [Marortus luteolus]
MTTDKILRFNPSGKTELTKKSKHKGNNVNKTILSSALTSILLISSSLTVAQDKVAGSGPNPFSDCGIGAALFTKTKWAAVSSNIIWDIGITAVTSATASPETCSGKTIETAQLIHRTYDELLEETARGNGSHLTSMLNMMGCENSNHAAATSDIRIKLSTEITNPNYQLKTAQEKSSAYYDAMNSAVTENCGS